jgi:hypothetical protein
MAWPRVVRVRLGGNAYPILMCSGSASKWPLVRAPHPASPFPFSTNGPAGSACNPSRETGGSLSVARSIDRAEWTTMLSYRQKIDRFLTREQAARAAKFFAAGRPPDGQSRRGRDFRPDGHESWARLALRRAGSERGGRAANLPPACGRGGGGRVGVVPRHDREGIPPRPSRLRKTTPPLSDPPLKGEGHYGAAYSSTLASLRNFHAELTVSDWLLILPKAQKPANELTWKISLQPLSEMSIDTVIPTYSLSQLKTLLRLTNSTILFLFWPAHSLTSKRFSPQTLPMTFQR